MPIPSDETSVSSESTGNDSRTRLPWSRRPGVLPAVVLLILLVVLDVVAIWRDSVIMPSLSWGNADFNNQTDPLLRNDQLIDSMRVDINTVGSADLQLLPGIGPALATRIIQDRNERGAFPSIDALSRVHGIGPKTIESIRPYVVPIRVDGEGGGS